MNIEQELIRQCIDKERKAQFALYKQLYSFLMSICIRYCNNREDAQSLLNLGYLKLLNNLEKYRQEIPFGLWTRRLMINTIIDEYRKNKKEKELLEYHDFTDRSDDESLTEVNDAVKRMDVQEIQNHIDKLPNVSKKVFNLFVVDGYGHKEIAEMLGITEGTSKWHLNNAREKLKEMINFSTTLEVTTKVKSKTA
jgi:RNA polymerase sigma factor (sigma-70 family)